MRRVCVISTKRVIISEASGENGFEVVGRWRGRSGRPCENGGSLVEFAEALALQHGLRGRFRRAE